MIITCQNMEEFITVANHFGIPVNLPAITVSFPHPFDTFQSYMPQTADELQDAINDDYVNGPNPRIEMSFEQFESTYLNVKQ